LLGAIYNYLFLDSKSSYLVVILILVDAIFSLLSVLNPIFQSIGNLHEFLSFFTQIQFRPIFGDSGRNFFIMRDLARAAPVTLQLSIFSMAFGFIIALFIATILSLPKNIFQPFAQLYIDYHRSTPLLVQLLIIYLGLPQLLQSIGEVNLIFMSIPFNDFRFTEFQAALFGLTLNTAAYQSEIIRGGIGAIPAGQTEAARGLGMTTPQTMRFVILPQAIRLIIPPLTNEGINVVLNSSLASIVTVFEITLTSRTLATFYFNTFEVYLTAAMFYFVMAFSLAKIAKKLEKRYRIPGLGIATT
jgi:His/Glu/Gln/Arg/opine family amino acid ABC transporter permease subunit